MTAHDPELHDFDLHHQRLAAVLAGGLPGLRAPGLAQLLCSLMPAPELPPSARIDMSVLLAEARLQGEAEGRAAGFAAGHAAATAELGPLRAALDGAIGAARAATAIDDAALRPLLADLVAATASAVLMAELRGGARVLAPLVAAALAEAADSALPTLIAHPETLALLGPELPPGLATATDPALPAAHIVLAAPDYRIETGIGERLARIVKALA